MKGTSWVVANGDIFRPVLGFLLAILIVPYYYFK